MAYTHANLEAEDHALGNIDFADILLKYGCLLFSLCVHEAAHAAMANRCGDPTARLMGRLTLNPMAHIDPIGTVVMPLMMMISRFPYLFGWAKPVPFNPRNLNNIRRDPVFIALAGPASNLLMAVISALVLRVLVLAVGIDGLDSGGLPLTFFRIAAGLLMINLALMLFNLIPIPPLDGSHVLHFFLPPSGQQVIERIGPFGIIFVILIARRVLTVPMLLILSGVARFAGVSLRFLVGL